MAAGLDHLLCNFRKCRKRLSSHAWVTSCSHIFCDEDGTREFQKKFTCPACDTNLSGKLDVIRVDLQPVEQYKSMVLAGQRPEVIMEVSSRALAFWTYQTHQERTYQEYVATKSKEKITQMEQYYEQVIAKTNSEISLLKNQISDKIKELEDLKKRHNEVLEKLMDKSRQYLKLQGMYDTLRRKTITPRMLGDSEEADGRYDRRAQIRSAFDFPLGSGMDLFRRCDSVSNLAMRRDEIQPPEREFTLEPQRPQPLSTPSRSAENLQSRFIIDFAGTPHCDVNKLIADTKRQ